MTAGHECEESHRDHAVKIITIRSKTALIDTQSLKNKILDLAIRGKLTRQLPDDGTAEELYEKIQEEKQALVEAGKIKTEKPLKEIETDEVPFEIPGNWKWVHLNNVAYSMLGKTLNKSKDVGDSLPYLCSINVYWEGINLENVKIAKFDNASKEKYRLQKGDLLICEGGESGRSAVWNRDEEMYYQNALHRVRFYGKNEPVFFCYVFELYKKTGIISKYTTGIGIQHLVQSALNSIWLPLPPVAEQKRIVEKVEILFAEIDTIEKLQSQYAADSEILKSKLIDAAIQGKLTEQLPSDGTAEELYQQIQTEKQALISAGKIKKEKPLKEIEEDEIPFEIPESWKWVRLSEIAYLTSGGQYKETQEGVPYVKVADMNSNENQYEIIKATRYVAQDNKGIISKGSIIFPKRGGAIATNKKRLVNRTEIYVDTNIMGMTVIYPPILPYVKIWFDSIDLETLQSGTSVPQINNKDLYPLLVPLPPLAEQQRIDERIKEMLK